MSYPIDFVEQFQKEAKQLLGAGGVKEVDFSGATYQIEVVDPGSKESQWPFLQFDEEGALKDAFCSCEEGEACLHLATSWLKIFGKEGIPLHQRFARSFWKALCRRVADHVGYEKASVEKEKEGAYLCSDASGVFRAKIKGKTQTGKDLIKSWIEEREKETPETSLKFSNLPQEEIQHWREGRASPLLRFRLSLWFDLAKWMLLRQEEGKKYSLTFEESEGGIPSKIHVSWKELEIAFDLETTDLETIIPTLDSVDSSLHVHPEGKVEIRRITYDPKQVCFLIEHGKKAEMGQGRPIGQWLYVPNKGFYSGDGETPLSADRIEREEISEVLSTYEAEVKEHLEGTSIHSQPISVSYNLAFSSEETLRVESFLFEKGDLLAKQAAFFGTWAYLPEKGFFPLKDAYFETRDFTIPKEEISYFITHEKMWLGTQEGFHVHLAGVETQLSYRVTSGGKLVFQAQLETAEEGGRDLGDWIYLPGQGFFSKQYRRLGTSIRPGVEVAPDEIASFIKKNREELEGVSGFFLPALPLAQRGIVVTVEGEEGLRVVPESIPLPEFENVPLKFFGEFVYAEGEGFAQLPAKMRLPEKFRKPLTIHQKGLSHFFTVDLDAIEGMILKLDPRLRIPHKLDLELDYLARHREGGLRAKLLFHTEWGRISLVDLFETLAQGRRYYFSGAGRLDLKDPRFDWLHTLRAGYDDTSQTVQISTLDFLRLEAVEGMLLPTGDSPQAEFTRKLTKEIRDFIAPERPELKGLRSELRLYQQTGLHWLWFLYRNGLSGILCDEMGLGKTHQAMALIASILNFHKAGEGRRFLVVSPTSVIYHWEDKLAEFLPRLKVHTFHGLKRSLARFPKEGVLLTSYGILRSEKKRLKELSFEVAIYDELQIAKNPSSRVHQALQTVNAKMRVGLTGTPIENTLSELKALFDLVLPGFMPGEKRFRDIFTHPIEREGDEEKKALLRGMIKPFILRRKKQDVLQELPEKSEEKAHCVLSPEQETLYAEILEKTKRDILPELADGKAPLPYIHIFSILSTLKQICDHPALYSKDPHNYKNYTSGKWDLFVELLDETRESEQKVVVFSQYLYMLDIIENYVKERGWGYAQIRGDTIDRREELRRFQKDPDCVVFIGSLQAAGLGIDLTAASTVILYDRWWNAARENQAIDRVHRIGQKWGVQVFKLITKKTIEEKIDHLITKKGRLMEEVVTADDQATLKKFSREELLDLLTY